MFNYKKLISLILIVFICVSAFAFQFSPMSATFDTKGAGAAKVYTVVNDSSSPIAVKVSASNRMLLETGEEELTDASAYFSIQPSKMIIKPQSSQLVRVQYRGPQNVVDEASYRIVAEQIPYSLGASEADSGQMISFLFVYSTTAYVSPMKIVEKVSSFAGIDSDGKLYVLIENTGSVHQLLNNLSVTVTGNDGSSYVMTDADMEGIKGANLLTKSKLRITIDMPEELKGAKTFKADVKYDYTYSK